MKLSLNRLGRLVNIQNVAPGDLADALTLSGSKTEQVTVLGGDIQNVVVGKVLSLTKHPGADRLTICAIDVGKGEPLQIVTGATNLHEGAVIPVALDGAVLPGGKTIHTGQMRGEKSEGMLCSGSELNLDGHDQPGADADGILILTDCTAPLGTDIREALELADVVLDFEITNNRPDCLSVYGLARETAATLRMPLTLPEITAVQGEGDISEKLTISVENPALCPRYAARMVENVKIAPSPQWMRRALRAMGVRPINNIVDITNLVMLEYGQPMHAFDYACVTGGRLVIRSARAGETLETLDGQVRRLDESMLVIADGENPTAVAGVMGGAASEITDSTATIVFESACFDGVSVRKTANALNMRTDASSRFEKGLDANNVLPALERACALVEELGAGTVVGGLIDICAEVAAPHSAPFPVDKINRRLGVSLSREDMLALLTPLGFADNGDSLTVPSWRGDVRLWEDVSEEVARFYGYDRIPATLPPSKNQGWQTPWQRFRERVATLCSSLGFDEALTWPFAGSADLAPFGYDPKNALTILNPAGEEVSLLRPDGLCSLLPSLSHNAAVRNPKAWLFELSTAFQKTANPLPEEELRLVMGAYGGNVDFLVLKGVLEALLTALGVPEATFAPVTDRTGFHTGRTASITLNGQVVGVIGELHPELCQDKDIPGRAAVLELALRPVFERSNPAPSAQPLPRYPAMQRDLALICPAELPHVEILQTIKASGGEHLRSCELFDVYMGLTIPEGKRSLAYRLLFRAADRTLREEEVDAAVNQVLGSLEERFGILVRS